MPFRAGYRNGGCSLSNTWSHTISLAILNSGASWPFSGLTPGVDWHSSNPFFHCCNHYLSLCPSLSLIISFPLPAFLPQVHPWKTVDFSQGPGLNFRFYGSLVLGVLHMVWVWMGSCISTPAAGLKRSLWAQQISLILQLCLTGSTCSMYHIAQVWWRFLKWLIKTSLYYQVKVS
jgi:hypothetical protein